MRVLITGVTGFAGRHLAALCLESGDAVHGLGRRDEAEGLVGAYLSADLADAAAARSAVAQAAPDAVCHLAADASVSRSWSSPAQAIERNLASTRNLLDAVLAEAPEARVLVACSGEEYGPVEPGALPVREAQPLRPQNPYAVSKAMCDLLAGFYGDAHGLQVVRPRAFNHAGPGQSDTYVVSSFARQIAEAEAAAGLDDRRVTVLTGNHEVSRDFSDVRDVARAYRLAVEQAEPGVYNVCSGRATSVADILARLAAHTSLEVVRQTDPQRVRGHEMMEMKGSHDKLTEATGWRPQIDLDTTLRDALAWWRERPGAERAR